MKNTYSTYIMKETIKTLDESVGEVERNAIYHAEYVEFADVVSCMFEELTNNESHYFIATATSPRGMVIAFDRNRISEKTAKSIIWDIFNKHDFLERDDFEFFDETYIGY